MPAHRILAAEPYTVELVSDSGATYYVRAAVGEIEHVTAVHPLVEATQRSLLLVSTHSGLWEQLRFFRTHFADGGLEGLDELLEETVVDVLANALITGLAPESDAA
jgi:hypothetical protein